MTLFEKIYFTCLALNVMFFILAELDVFEDCSMDLEWLGDLLGYQVVLTLGYLVVKLILYIWGIDINLFPCIKVCH